MADRKDEFLDDGEEYGGSVADSVNDYWAAWRRIHDGRLAMPTSEEDEGCSDD